MTNDASPSGGGQRPLALAEVFKQNPPKHNYLDNSRQLVIIKAPPLDNRPTNPPLPELLCAP
ncbi:hypothetical protein CEK71_19245 [Methylovulum psychrotolerans]|uniref:Uncharacterized protein n=1 Tax=Methylovulum psychrotolerans TaxID=1704499 RepID=A0A1Z4C3B8_9GAMM|nr:hypothetical protein CEK71_19245 [Methylovulum psychrotolerans]